MGVFHVLRHRRFGIDSYVGGVSVATTVPSNGWAFFGDPFAGALGKAAIKFQ
jgi:hypothetical protein